MTQVQTDLDVLKKKTGAVTSFMTGPLGFLGVSVGVASVTQKLRELGEEDRQMRRLASTVQRFAGTAPDMRELNKVLVDMRRNSLFGDTELTATLAQLTTQVGDYSKALRLLPLVADVAAGSQKSLAESAKLVANAEAGIVEPLGELLPQIKVWARENSNLVGTLEASKYAMDQLRQSFGGAAKDEVAGLGGSFKLLGEGVSEFTDSILELYATGIAEWARTVGGLFDRLAEAIRAGKSAMGDWANLIAANPILNPLGTGRTIAGMFGGQGVTPQTGTNRVGIGDGLSLLPFEGGAGGNVYEPGGTGRAAAMGDMMSNLRNVYVPIIDPRGPETMREVADELRVIKDLREEISELDVRQIEDTKILAATLQDSFYGAFQAIRGGWAELMSYMKELLMREVLMNLAAAAVNAIFPGAGTFTPFGKAIGLGGGGASAAGGFGMQGAIAQQQSWRMTRRVYG